MYDVMIIDDDITIIEHLKSMIHWKHLGLVPVCEAKDSDTALELYRIHQPKIVILDIKIPTISGIDLANKLSNLDPEIRFIVITGYNDFEYIKESVALGAVDLLTKPILEDEINKSLEKAISYFTELRNKQASSIAKEQIIKENIPMLRKQYISYLFKPNPEGYNFNTKERLETLKLDVLGSFYAVIIISPDLYHISSKDIDTVLFGTKNISEDNLALAGFKIFSFIDDICRLNCLVSWDFNKGNAILEETVNRIYEKVNFYLKIRIFAGIGQPVIKLSKIHMSWGQAVTALNYQNVLSTDTVINYKNIERLESPIVADKEQIIGYLSKLFKMNKFKKVSDLLNRHFNSLIVEDNDSIIKMREFAFKYVSTILYDSYSLGINIEEIALYSDILSNIFNNTTILALKQYILELTEKLLKLITKKRTDSKNSLIEMGKKFIVENLGNNSLNLEMVSNHINLSRTYFCKLFHKEVGISFNEYLNTVRIKQAKKLLANTNKKVYEISYETGYGNPKHFNYVFKRVAGVTPLGYRKLSENKK